MNVTRRTVRRTRIGLAFGRWFLIIGLTFYSLMTTTPLVAAHSEWAWSGFALGLIVDAAFIMALSAEGTLAKFGMTELGRWPVVFRWFTGLSSVFLNVWTSVSGSDPVGVAIHMIAPALVMILAEVGPVFMKHLADAERMAEPEPAGPETDTDEPLTAPEPDSVPDVPEIAKPAVQLELPATRLSKADAHRVIESGFAAGLTAKEVAASATRHPNHVARVFRELAATS